MRAIEQTFKDAYVEFYGLRDGMGAVPYLPQSWFDCYGNRGCPTIQKNAIFCKKWGIKNDYLASFRWFKAILGRKIFLIFKSGFVRQTLLGLF